MALVLPLAAEALQVKIEKSRRKRGKMIRELGKRPSISAQIRALEEQIANARDMNQWDRVRQLEREEEKLKEARSQQNRQHRRH